MAMTLEQTVVLVERQGKQIALLNQENTQLQQENTQLQQENTQLQQENTQLQQENRYLRGQLGEQSRQLQEQAKLIELLQARLNRNSTTSSKPPASDGPSVKRPKKKPTGRKRGGQKGHTGHHRPRVPPAQVGCPPSRNATRPLSSLPLSRPQTSPMEARQTSPRVAKGQTHRHPI